MNKWFKHKWISLQYKYFTPTWHEFPRSIEIDTMNICNLDCVYCNVKEDGAYKKKRGFMSDETFRLLIKLLDPHKKYIDNIALFMNGEPLLEKRLPAFCDMLLEHPYNGIIVSNGTIPEQAHTLMHPFFKTIRISLSAHNRETYKKIHGVDKFDEATETLSLLIRNKLRHQDLFINHMVCKQNEKHLDDFLETFKEYVIQVFPLHSGPLQTASITSMSETVQEPFRVYPDGRFEKMWDKIRGIKPCQCWDILGVGLRGEIMHCVDYPAEYNWGNIYDTDLKQAWKERNILGLEHELCKNCNLNLNKVTGTRDNASLG